MHLESEVSFDVEAPTCPEKVLVPNGEAGVASSTPDHILQQQPAKKPTRQWAAWTRQEEESFFTALRQVGKNFEKITCRVQSKNKDQVRHYYYRLVRRMNKLLGPGLCLDAKNSKDTNAAMLRWWSLLEKYSCKASKLHLKPRRFKIFIEALEHQLLKDRKKNIRKRPFLGENCPPPAPNSVSNQNRPSGHEGRTLKFVLFDSQNIPKLSPGKASLKRNVTVAVNRGNNKGESTAMKPLKQRKKQGIVSSATYKRWEKAAIAGVSLVADAAEHLERTSTDKDVEPEQVQKYDPVRSALSPLPTFQQNILVESAINTFAKLKLQLFPIDDSTRRALEMDKHNPHLELTLSTRKKISSVLEHLTRKWGNSSAASGELMLFPYNVQRENAVGGQTQSWTQDSVLSAADVYAMIGSPPVFRLRYGWFSNTEPTSFTLQAPIASCCIPGKCDDMENRVEKIVDSAPISDPSTNVQSMDLCKDKVASVNKNTVFASTSTVVANNMNGYITADQNNKLAESSDLIANFSWDRKDASDGTIARHIEDADDLRLSNGNALSAGEWADSLTNISIGDLLSGASQDMNSDCTDQPVVGSSLCLQQIPFSCDSFDAAIAAHISRQQEKIGAEPTLASHASSIWDAEETCDAFSFQKNPMLCTEVKSSRFTSSRSCEETSRMAPVGSSQLIEEFPQVERPVDDFTQRDPMNEDQSDPEILDSSGKDISGLADMYWPDSLGPLDLDIPSSKYHSEDLFISDSGLNRLIASSLDAFQSCSFLGVDKKESVSTVEARGTASFSDFKIGS